MLYWMSSESNSNSFEIFSQVAYHCVSISEHNESRFHISFRRVITKFFLSIEGTFFFWCIRNSSAKCGQGSLSDTSFYVQQFTVACGTFATAKGMLKQCINSAVFINF